MGVFERIPARIKIGLSTIALVLSIYIVVQVAGIFMVLALEPSLLDEGAADIELAPWQTFVVYLASFATMLGSLWWVLHRHLKNLKAIIKSLQLKVPKPIDVGYALAGYGVYFLSLYVVFRLLDFLQLVNLDQDQDVGFANPSGASLILVFLALVVLAPISEEILFRGFLYKRLKKLFGIPTAAITSSLLFGLAHQQFNVGIDTFILSLAMVYVFEETQNLSTPILLHATKNAIAFLVVFIL